MKNIITFLVFSLFALQANATDKIPCIQDTVIRTKTTIVTTDSITGETKTTITETEKTVPSVKIPKSSVSMGGSNYNFIFSWQKKNNKRIRDSHWSGIGMGFMNYDDKKIPHSSLKMSKSHNFTVNLIEYNRQIRRSNWLFVSGIGFEWSRYHFDGNVSVRKVEGITGFYPETEGRDYNDSKLLLYYVTLPLLLEYQNSSFHISGGVVGFIKYYSKSEINYYVNNKKYEKSFGQDLNIRPVDLKLRLQLGIDNISVYGYYSPFSMFSKDKGPELRTYTIGVMLGIN